jgi:hypothetical protein
VGTEEALQFGEKRGRHAAAASLECGLERLTQLAQMRTLSA